MNSILSAIGLSGSRIPQFPYTLDDSCEPVRCQFIPTITWLLQDGIANSSELASPGGAGAAPPRRVSVFHISLAELQPEDRELARNAMMRAKKLRIQGMIRCHAAVEHKNHLYIATDRCRPLDDFLLKPRAKDGHHSISEVANGVKGICKGLHSIHVNGLVHGNVRRECVFVLESGGFWSLFGFELLSQLGSQDDSEWLPFLSGFPRLGTETVSQPPECRSLNDPTSLRRFIQNLPTPYTLDTWGVAGLLYAVLRVVTVKGKRAHDGSLPTVLTVENARECASALPLSVRSSFLKLTNANPADRMRLNDFLESSALFTEDTFVKCMEEISMYAVLEATEKEALVNRIEAGFASDYPQSMVRFPLAGSLWMLQQIIDGLHIYSPRNTVICLLRLGQCYVGDVDFDEHIGPAVVQLYGSSDKFVRLQLLESVPLYVDHLSKSRIAEIWPLFLKGFRSPSPEMLSQTAYQATFFAPFLEPQSVVELAAALSELQQRCDASLRTVPLLCLHHISQYIPQSQRAAAVIPTFSRGAADASLPVRVAATEGFHGCLTWASEQNIVVHLMPALLKLAVDESARVRPMALRALHKGLQRLEAYNAACPVPDSPMPTAPGAAAAGSSSGLGEVASVGDNFTWCFDLNEAKQEARKTMLSQSSTSLSPVMRAPHASSIPRSVPSTPQERIPFPGVMHPSAAGSRIVPPPTVRPAPAPAPPLAVRTHTDPWVEKWSDDDDASEDQEQSKKASAGAAAAPTKTLPPSRRHHQSESSSPASHGSPGSPRDAEASSSSAGSSGGMKLRKGLAARKMT